MEWEQVGRTSEKIAENIVEDLFTEVLDWDKGFLRYQIGHADIVLTNLGVKYLIVETKRPGSLSWNQRAIEASLAQARGYAAAQRVTGVAVSDGRLLYVTNVRNGGLQDRLLVSLESPTPQAELWWVSVQGIYREHTGPCDPQSSADEQHATLAHTGQVLHPKYGLPMACFAYVGDPLKTSSWRLPYRLLDGNVDEKRLPKAIQCIVTNYRGARVSGIPETAVPDVLRRLAASAAVLGRMPHQQKSTALVYQQLQQALDQMEPAGSRQT
jgi:hypothetical protein